MEDYLIREINRIGEMLVMIARRLGLYGGGTEAIHIDDFKSEVADSGLGMDIDEGTRQSFLQESVTHLDNKGCFSFMPHSYL